MRPYLANQARQLAQDTRIVIVPPPQPVDGCAAGFEPFEVMSAAADCNVHVEAQAAKRGRKIRQLALSAAASHTGDAVQYLQYLKVAVHN